MDDSDAVKAVQASTQLTFRDFDLTAFNMQTNSWADGWTGGRANSLLCGNGERPVISSINFCFILTVWQSLT